MKRLLLACMALAATPAPVAAQQRIDRPGTWVHEAAGTGFPEQVGEFRRTNVYVYDQAGANASASYSLTGPDGRLHLTVYVYPSPRVPGQAAAESCRREYEEARGIIATQNDDAERIEDGAAPPAEGTSGRRSVYRFTILYDGQEQPVRSEIDLYCHVGGEWQVKYRATSPAAFDASAEIETFIRTGPWPGRSAVPDAIAAPTAHALEREAAP
jgi:hypothetical protein